MHMGFHLGMDLETARNNLVDNVIHIIQKTEQTAPDVELLLEVSAGAGTQMGSTLAELTDIIRLFQEKTTSGAGMKSTRGRFGICLDTQHMFSAGIDIRGSGGLDPVINHFRKHMEIGLIRLIHLNDSAVKLGAHRDMHAGLGDGYIFGTVDTGLKNQCRGTDVSLNSRPLGVGLELSVNGMNNPDGVAILTNIVNTARKHRIPLILETHGAGNPGSHDDKPEHTSYATEIGILRAISNGESVSRLVDSHRRLRKISKKQAKKSLARGRPLQTQAANWPLIAKFQKLRAYYTDVDRDKIRALAYGKAVMALQAYPDPILSGQQVAHLAGIGKKMADKIDEFVKTGTMKIFRELDIDAQIAEWTKQRVNSLDSVLGLGPARVHGLAKQGIRTVADLRTAVKDGKVKLSKMETIGLEYHDDLQKKVARPETEAIYKAITQHSGIKALANEYGLQIELAGSYPSGRLESKDIDLLVFTNKFTDPAKISVGIMKSIQRELTEAGLLVATVNIGAGKLMGLVRLDSKHPVRHVDIRLIPLASAVYGRFYFTSGRDFNQMVRQQAKKQGYRLNEYGLFDLRTGKTVEGLDTEEAIMDRIGLGYISMSKRRG
jgi:DNA polymerase beta